MNDLFQEAREIELIAQFAPIRPKGQFPATHAARVRREAVDAIEMLRWAVEQLPIDPALDGDYLPAVSSVLTQLDELQQKIETL